MPRIGLLVALGLGLIGMATTAHADREELRLELGPTLALARREDGTNRGFGGMFRTSYGLRDVVSVAGALECDRFASVVQPGVRSNGALGAVYYDAFRCDVMPGVALHLGAQYVTSLTVGLGYRFERRSQQDFVVDDVLVEHLPARVSHQAIGAVRIAFDYRINDVFAAGAFVGGTLGLGSRADVDLNTGASLSLYVYP